MKPSARHHHNPVLHLRQFAEPMFSDSLCVFERKTGRWDTGRRTPGGIGYARHLYSSWDIQGQRGDHFERFLTTIVDTPCADAIKKAGVDPWSLSRDERVLVARFVAFAAARTRNLLEVTECNRLRDNPTDEWLLREWCKMTGKEFTSNADGELLRSSLFRAATTCAVRWMERILPWKWHFLRTTRDAPFILSDWPAAGTFDIGHHLLTFPISTEIALVTSSHPGVGLPHGGTVDDVRAINLRTMHHATKFLVCNKKSFPGDDFLPKWTAA